jgi:hypothetical protein
LEKGHSATKEFFDTIKKQRTQVLITKVEGEDGQVVTTQEEGLLAIRIIIQSNICQECRRSKDKGARELFIRNLKDKIPKYTKCSLVRPMIEGELLAIGSKHDKVCQKSSPKKI